MTVSKKDVEMALGSVISSFAMLGVDIDVVREAMREVVDNENAWTDMHHVVGLATQKRTSCDNCEGRGCPKCEPDTHWIVLGTYDASGEEKPVLMPVRDETSPEGSLAAVLDHNDVVEFEAFLKTHLSPSVKTRSAREILDEWRSAKALIGGGGA